MQINEPPLSQVCAKFARTAEKNGNGFTVKSNLPDERNISTMMYVV